MWPFRKKQIWPKGTTFYVNGVGYFSVRRKLFDGIGDYVSDLYMEDGALRMEYARLYKHEAVKQNLVEWRPE